jgi:hypothetical protein
MPKACSGNMRERAIAEVESRRRERVRGEKLISRPFGITRWKSMDVPILLDTQRRSATEVRQPSARRSPLFY